VAPSKDVWDEMDLPSTYERVQDTLPHTKKCRMKVLSRRTQQLREPNLAVSMPASILMC